MNSDLRTAEPIEGNLSEERFSVGTLVTLDSFPKTFASFGRGQTF